MSSKNEEPVECCDNCYYHDPFEGEETPWYQRLKHQPDKTLCHFGFTDKDWWDKAYAHKVGKKQKCPAFRWPFRWPEIF